MAEVRNKFNDLGLGVKATAGNTRALNKNGSFNIKKVNIPFFERLNIFHTLISMSWLQFFAFILLFYIVSNLLFASAYYIIGVEHLQGIIGHSKFDYFLEAFFFSAQTITTLGYGRVAPMGLVANFVSALESMIGLMSFALATGLLYGRFSKPAAKIKYSSHAIIAPFQDINAFMFRIINLHSNQLLDVEASLTLTMQNVESEIRDFYSLELERDKVLFFPSTWTIVHPINELSPLCNLARTDFLEKDAEFIVNIKAYDQTSGQNYYSQTSYKASELNWGEKFVYLVNQQDGQLVIDAGRLDETEPAILNKGFNQIK